MGFGVQGGVVHCARKTFTAFVGSLAGFNPQYLAYFTTLACATDSGW